MSARIRPFQPEDARALTALFRRSVEGLGPRHYTAEQVRAWADRAPTPERFRERAADGRVVLVAVDEADRPLAFGDLEPSGHLDMLYCAPEAAGTGVAAALYDRLEAIARDQGQTRLFVEASEAARPFFLTRGFVVKARQERILDGVSIHNFAMDKILDDRAADPPR